MTSSSSTIHPVLEAAVSGVAILACAVASFSLKLVQPRAIAH